MSEFAAILLAAGGSSRLGRSKQLLPYRGQSLVRRAAGHLTALTSRVFVVTGAKRLEVELELEELPVRTLHNERWREGVGTSIALGVDHLPESARAVLILMCDQYRLEPEDLERFVAIWQEEPGRVLAARWDKMFGPPVIFPRALFPQLVRLTGDLGARRLLVQHRSRVRFQDLPEAGIDVDEPMDLTRMQRHEAELENT